MEATPHKKHVIIYTFIKTIKTMEEKSWVYYGIFFSDDTKKSLIEDARRMGYIPQGWKIYCDHMTIIFNDHSGKQNISHLEESLGKKVTLIIDSIGISDRAFAFGVANYKTSNRQSHITIAIVPEGKPVESNNIQKWVHFHPFTIEGTLDVIRPRV